MRTLLKYELKKIFSNKFVIVMLIAAAVVSVFAPAKLYYELQKDVWSDPAYYEYLKSIPNFEINGETVEKMRRELEAIEADNNSYDFYPWYKNPEGFKTSDIPSGSIYQGRFRTIGFDLKPLSEEDKKLTEKYDIIINDETLPKYLFLRDTINRYDRYSKAGENRRDMEKFKSEYPDLSPLFYEHEKQSGVFWEKEAKEAAEGYTVGYNLGWEIFNSSAKDELVVWALLLLLAVGLSGVFTGEFEARTDSLIFSSRYGRAKIARVKMLASVIFTFVSMAIIFSFMAITCLAAAGPKGATVSALNAWNGPSGNLPMWQMSLKVMGITTAAAVIAAMIILLISSVNSHVAITLFVSASLLLVPVLNLLPYGTSPIITQMSMLSPLNVAREYEVLFYFFGKWIDFNSIVPIDLILVLAAFVPITVAIFKRRQVRN